VEGFEAVGWLAPIVTALREMVLLPLLAPGAFAALGVQPPCGTLLHGAPGTGKTLTVGGARSALFALERAKSLSPPMS
jgi:ATP-dependent 26S proteasome regulatory subunit